VAPASENQLASKCEALERNSKPLSRIRSAWRRRLSAAAPRCTENHDGGWHNDGMSRIRLSTTVDADLLSNARSVRSGVTDAALIDEALGAFLARERSAEVDASYAAYDEHPVDERDEWGDLASWRRAASAT
jgi:hypothetical protein